ncbi:MAG: GTP-binding protein [Candidatus Odinarchaeia archaeon]
MQSLNTTNVVKISITGLPGVGKTTLTNLLTNKRIPKKHDPTIGINFANTKINEIDSVFSIFDFAGDGRFGFILDDLLKGSEIVLLVTDSTPKNVLNTRKLADKIKQSPVKKVIAIANKQDLDGALSPDRVGNILGLETYGMIAIDCKQKVHMYRVLINALKGKK